MSTTTDKAGVRLFAGPGTDHVRLQVIAAELDMDFVVLATGTATAAPCVLVIAESSVGDLEQLRQLAAAGPLIVLLSGALREAWGSHATCLPRDSSEGVLAGVVALARDGASLRHRLSKLEADDAGHRERFAELNRVGIALSAEHDIDDLQDLVLRSSRQLTRADGATLYLVEESEDHGRELRFAWSQSHSITDSMRTFTIPLVESNIAGYTVLTGETVKLDDAYEIPAGAPYRFGGRPIDEKNSYRTKSMLCVPMRNHSGDVVGAIQLINAKRDPDQRIDRDNADLEVVPFEDDDVELVQSLASQAAVALDNQRLLDAIESLFAAFVEASTEAIDKRDPATSGHSRRVRDLTVALANTVTGIGTGRYADVAFDDGQIKELSYAAVLHDFGKVGVPEHILGKQKKLPSAQLDLIRARFAFVQRSIEHRFAERKLALSLQAAGRLDPEAFGPLEHEMAAELEQVERWLAAVVSANEPSVLPEDKATTLGQLAEYMYEDTARRRQPLLTADEFHFLSIPRGSLDPVERLEIESHVSKSFDFLVKIPWTPLLRNVPNIAYGHHELLDGSGYPRRLKAADIPVQARMMTIADVFDALTAKDRPYKPAVSLDRALTILDREFEGKIDRDLFDIFVSRRVYDVVLAGGHE